jgi:hypothetical protein
VFAPWRGVKALESITYSTAVDCGTAGSDPAITGYPDTTSCINYIQPFIASRTGYVKTINLYLNNSYGTRTVYVMYTFDTLCNNRKKIDIADLTSSGLNTITLTSTQFPVIQGGTYGIMFSTISCSQQRGLDSRLNCGNSESRYQDYGVGICSSHYRNKKMTGSIIIEYEPNTTTNTKKNPKTLVLFSIVNTWPDYSFMIIFLFFLSLIFAGGVVLERRSRKTWN